MIDINTQSRMKNSLRNSLSGFLGQIALLLFSFISRTVFIKYLGEEFLGINGLYTNILSLLSLSELGVGNVMLYMLYQPIAKNDKEKINQYISYFKNLYHKIAFAILFLGIILIPFLPIIINSELDNYHLILYYLLFLLNSVSSYLFIYKSILIDALQQKYVITLTTSLTTIIKNIIQIFVIVLFKSYTLYLVIQIIFTIITNLIISRICDRRYMLKTTGKNSISKIDKLTIKNKIQSTFVYKIGTVLINNSENIIISALLGTSIVGFYSNYTLIVSSITAFISIFNSSIFSSIGNMIATEKKSIIKNNFFTFIFLYWFISVFLSITLFFTFNRFIILWIGNKYIFPNYVVFFISLKFFVSNISNPLWIFREASGLFEKVKYIIVFTALCTILFSVGLGYLYGMSGILIGAILARIATLFWYEPYLLNKFVLKTRITEYWYIVFKYLILSCGIFLIMCFINGFIGNGFISIILIAIIVFILTFTMFFIVNFKDKYKNNVINKSKIIFQNFLKKFKA